MIFSASRDKSRKVKPSKAVWLDSRAVGKSAVSMPMAGSTDMATPSEHLPMQLRSCMVTRRFVMVQTPVSTKIKRTAILST